MTPEQIAAVHQMEADLINLSNANLLVLFHILFQKKIISYSDFQDAIGVAREAMPPTEHLRRHFDRLERTYQPGPYNRPPDSF